LAAQRAGLAAIMCVGEERDDRDAGHTQGVVGRQLDGSLPDNVADVVIAYEPVWAIGSGQTPTPGDVADIHDFIRARLCRRFGDTGHAMRILYGGSVKPANAKDLLKVDNVDGALIGGASLKADEFLAIAGIYR
jgi:triosephosphate isomerase